MVLKKLDLAMEVDAFFLGNISRHFCFEPFTFVQSAFYFG